MSALDTEMLCAYAYDGTVISVWSTRGAYHCFFICLFPRDILVTAPELRGVRSGVLKSVGDKTHAHVSATHDFHPLQTVASPPFRPPSVIAYQLSNDRASSSAFFERCSPESRKAQVAGKEVTLFELVGRFWLEIKRLHGSREVYLMSAPEYHSHTLRYFPKTSPVFPLT
jgi:hypothetical protein